MVVFDPVKIIIDNYPEGETESFKIEETIDEANQTYRDVPFSREILIERNDFMEIPPKKYFRLFPGGIVRLKGACIIKCESLVKDEAGTVTDIHCTYFPESKSGHDTSGLNPKGTIHWVNAKDAVEVEVKEYDRLFKVENPSSEEGDFKDYINPDSLNIVTGYAEPALTNAKASDRFQFLRKGYYCLDKDSTKDKLIFNRTVTLKDAWAKEVKK